MNKTHAQSYHSIFTPELRGEIKRIELITKRKVDVDTLGRYRSAFRGSGLVFTELREYQPGDDIRAIHWKATARSHGKVFVKSYEEDRSLTVILAIDSSASTRFGSNKSNHQRAVEFAALITMLARSNGDSIGLCLFSDGVEEYLAPSSRRCQMQRILLPLLEEKAFRRNTNIAVALQKIRELQRKPAIVFVLSDFYSHPFSDELAALAFRHDVVCVRIADSFEKELPDAGLIELQDPETGERVLVDSSSRKVREAIAAQFSRQNQELVQLCKKHGVDAITLAEDPLAPLLSLMKERATRRME